MKTITIVIAFGFIAGFIAGAALSYDKTAQHYKKKASKEQAAYAKTLAEIADRSDHYKKISEEYYADYQDAINREPTVITNRVLVRANCPTNATADTGGGVGNAATEGRAELHAEIVRGATEVTYQAERDVLSCRAALHSLQNKIIKHNELQR